jgi:hypothetical protein
MDSDTHAPFLTHAARARLVAERGHAIFWELAEALRRGAAEMLEEGDTEGAEDTLKTQQDLADWWTDNLECIDCLVHDYTGLARERET